MKRSTSPLQESARHYGYEQPSHPQSQPFLLHSEWQMPEQPHLAYPLETTYPQQYSDAAYTIPYQTSPTSFIPSQHHMNHGLNIEGAYLPAGSHMDGMSFDWQDFQNELVTYQTTNGLPEMTLAPQSIPEHSPTGTCLEVRSQTSNGSDSGWALVDYTQSLDSSLQDPQAAGAIFNPSQTLHNRTLSDSSYSDLDQQSRHSWSSGYVDVPNAISSPGTDSLGDIDLHYDYCQSHDHSQYEDDAKARPKRPAVVTSVSQPIHIKKSFSPQRSPTSSGKSTSPIRRQSRKTNNTKSLKAVARRPSQVPKVDSEKRIGRRKGPLRPEQRKQAGEIRKLGACIRCKFLKKTVSLAIPAAPCGYLTVASATKGSLAADACPLMLVFGLSRVPGSILKS